MLTFNSQFHIDDNTRCGDKSVSHRALIFAAVSQGKCIINNISLCCDVLATADCLRKLGAEVTFCGTTATVEPIGELPSENVVLNCRNSGTTARLLAGLVAGLGVDATFVGDESLRKRPMNRILQPLSQMGAEFRLPQQSENFLFRNIPRKLRGTNLVAEVNSAQVKSGVILAALNTCGETTYTEKIPTRNHTEILARRLGADVLCDKSTIYVRKNDDSNRSGDFFRVSPFEIDIPNDISSIFFLVAFSLLAGEEHVFKDVCLNPRRTGGLRVLQNCDAKISVENERCVFGEQIGNIRVEQSALNQIFANEADVCDAIDEIPILAALAVATKGTHVFQNVAELRFKECDRVRAIIAMAETCGQKATFDGKNLIIESDGKPTKQPNFRTYDDHRMAMSQAVLCLGACDGGSLDGENFDVSFPDFLRSVGVSPLRFALIGSNISQSKSPDLMRYFALKSRVCCGYYLETLPPEATDERLLDVISRYDGCNVTMPFKTRVARLSNSAEPSVNTVGKGISPQSTDGYGVIKSLRDHGINPDGQALWIVGAGGAAEAAIAALKKLHCRMQIFNRTPEHADILRRKYGFDEVKNPVGVLSFVPECDFERNLQIPETVGFVFSARYGEKNSLKSFAEKRGIVFVDGLEMLFHQGAKSFSLWTGTAIRTNFREWETMR